MGALWLPHPIPYQGSKRRLASSILATIRGRRFACLYEPFAGSAAVTIAACHLGTADRYLVSDSLAPLVALWRRIVLEPAIIAAEYEALWNAQLHHGASHFLEVRGQYNRDADPAKLLYLLARCVKNAPRWNRRGEFNQSADHRRRGMNPRKMRREIESASALLRGRVMFDCGDFTAMLQNATRTDLVYLDPPWEGTSNGANKRYHAWLSRDTLTEALFDLTRRDVPWLLSYDGRHGDKQYGPPLPGELGAIRLALNAGRSAQATLNGRTVITIESLYISSTLSSIADTDHLQATMALAA